MVDQNFERQASGEFAPCCPMDACKPEKYANADQSWEGELSLGTSCPIAVERGESYRANERGLLNLSKKRCVVV